MPRASFGFMKRACNLSLLQHKLCWACSCALGLSPASLMLAGSSLSPGSPTTSMATGLAMSRLIHKASFWRTVIEGRAAAPSTRHGTLAASQSFASTLKRGKPPVSKDSQPWKRKTAQTSDPSLNMTIAYSYVPTHKVILDYSDVLDETYWPPENRKIFVHNAILNEVWNRNEMIIDDAFVYTIATNIMLYVNDMNLIGTPAELEEIVFHLKSKFEMKDLRKTLYYLGLKIDHCLDGILVHQSNYTQKVLRCFNEDKSKPSSTFMIVRKLDAKRDPFHPKEDEEEILEPEVLYLSAIGALLYLTQYTRPDISFTVNLLARYSNAPTRRHWNGVKDIFQYLKGTMDLGLFYTHESFREVASLLGHQVDSCLVGYEDAGYLFDPHRVRSQMSYVFTVGDTAVSWRFTKQTLVMTSSNHA
ncbi:hypothetical protein ACFX12_003540 [Malus domestica]